MFSNKVSVRVGVRVRFSVVSGYARVFILLSVVIVTLPLNMTCWCCYLRRRSGEEIANIFGSGIGAIWLDEVGCAGSELSLADCSHDGWGVHDCKRDEEVAIECNPPVTTPAAGMIGGGNIH